MMRVIILALLATGALAGMYSVRPFSFLLAVFPKDRFYGILMFPGSKFCNEVISKFFRAAA